MRPTSHDTDSTTGFESRARTGLYPAERLPFVAETAGHSTGSGGG